MDDYCCAKMATSCQRETERESTSRKKTETADKDVQQLISHPEELLTPLPAGSSTLKQETPQPPCIKKEEEELCITQEGECLLGREEADYTKLPLTVVSVKTEDDEEKPQVDNLLAPLSDSEAEDEVEKPLNSDTDCERDMRTHTDNKHSECSTKKRDLYQLIGHPQELPSQSQGQDSTLKQETPQPPRIKKEEEELWIIQEGECLLVPQEADLINFPLTVVSVKTEDDEEKPQPDNLLAPLSDSEAENEFEEPLSSDTDCEGDMRTHTDNKHSESSSKKRGKTCLSCSVCAKSFAEKSNLTQHMRAHTGEQTFNCSVNKKHSGNSKINMSKKYLRCSVCPKSFSHKGNLISHMRTHTGEKPYTCSVCGRSFSQNSSLTKHMTTHTGEKRFTCSVCRHSFSLKSSLTKHARTHTGEKPFTCSVCGKRFTQKSSVTGHMRTHTGEKTFNCSVCGKGFSQKNHMVPHMRTHTGEKNFNCSDCGKSFSLKSSLTKHIRTHTGEKPFRCSVCAKSFATMWQLTQHMITHNDPKAFSCSVCAKSFSRNSYLTQHMRTHTGENQFNCSDCGKSFFSRQGLVQHNMKHTGEKPFSCSVCNQSFRYNTVALRHLKTHKGK
ncbi:gastrula zinc finger protein XlCGF57.1-like [Nerophis ophidion]|uniref:gastrula zinc finger protein XlCGF57.1-like n=1 Tax=Nerophis ophidion TaxID=159077 RepID=UPI002AE07778|nr:gastrula zinc finger protein XlCGF57.1-like [Nerophis ophidion]